jgi:hypothetical protein
MISISYPHPVNLNDGVFNASGIDLEKVCWVNPEGLFACLVARVCYVFVFVEKFEIMEAYGRWTYKEKKTST